MAINQNTLYLTTPGTVVTKKNLTLRVEIEKETRLSVPIHHLESICAFGRVVITPPAMALCWDHQVAIHYHTENGYLLAQVLGSGDTRYLLRRAQYTAADDPREASGIARQFVAGKLQNARSNLLRAGRETESDVDRKNSQALPPNSPASSIGLVRTDSSLKVLDSGSRSTPYGESRVLERRRIFPCSGTC